MADHAKPVSEGGAEQAYGEASAQHDPAKPGAAVTKVAAVSAAPAQAPKPAPAKAAAPKPTAADKPAPAPVPVQAAPVVATVKAKHVKTAPAKAAPAKPMTTKASPVGAAVVDAVSADPIKTKTQPTVKPAAQMPAPVKETPIMATTPDFTNKIQTTVQDVAAKAKTFAEKGQAGLGEVTEFTKGNVEAMVESTKILASGMQEMGKGYVAEAKTAFETMTADVKDLAAAKSPTEFFEKQTAIMKKNFDAAVAKSSKSSEAMLKLVNEAFQPLSTRMSLAMEKAKKAA